MAPVPEKFHSGGPHKRQYHDAMFIFLEGRMEAGIRRNPNVNRQDLFNAALKELRHAIINNPGEWLT